MSQEKTREVLDGYRATLERQLGRLWVARERYQSQIEAIDTEMGKVRQALDNLGTIQVKEPESEPVAGPAIRELKTTGSGH